MILSPPDGAPATYVTDLVEQWRQCRTFSQPFNLQLVRRPLPAWKTLSDDDIDLNYHLRHVALPVPGGERELGIVVSELHSRPLDLQRPPWEAYVIEGLARGRFAIFLKFHHGQLDGLGAARLIGSVMSTDPSSQHLGPPWTPGLDAQDDTPGSLLSPPAVDDRNPGLGSLPGIRETVAALRTAHATASAAQRLAMMTIKARLDNSSELVGPYQAPHTILNNRITGQRRFATQHYELRTFESIAQAAGVTINDVFLSITGGALRRYLINLDALPNQTIIGQIPVDIPSHDDAGNVGDTVTFMYARLHTDIADPLQRLEAVSASVRAGRSVQESLPADQVGPFTMLLLGPYMAEAALGLGGYLGAAHNLIVSEVPGPRERLYLNGCRIEQIYGTSVLFHGQALNIAMSTYAEGVDISYTACRESVPHVQRLAVYTGEALSTLEDILLGPRTAGAKPRRLLNRAGPPRGERADVVLKLADQRQSIPRWAMSRIRRSGIAKVSIFFGAASRIAMVALKLFRCRMPSNRDQQPSNKCLPGESVCRAAGFNPGDGLWRDRHSSSTRRIG